jgi:hypothetical protein
MCFAARFDYVTHRCGVSGLAMFSAVDLLGRSRVLSSFAKAAALGITYEPYARVCTKLSRLSTLGLSVTRGNDFDSDDSSAQDLACTGAMVWNFRALGSIG